MQKPTAPTRPLHAECFRRNSSAAAESSTAFVFVDLLIKLDSFVPVVAFVGELDSAFDSPEKIRTERDKAMRCIPVGDTAHVAVDAKDLLQHDDAWSIATRGQGKIAVELPAVE